MDTVRIKFYYAYVHVLVRYIYYKGGVHFNITYPQDDRIACIHLENVRRFLILRLFNDDFQIHEPRKGQR
jgi:hypothetical protein